MAYHSGIIGWWAEQTAAAIDQTGRTHICCVRLCSISLPFVFPCVCNGVFSSRLVFIKRLLLLEAPPSLEPD